MIYNDLLEYSKKQDIEKDKLDYLIKYKIKKEYKSLNILDKIRIKSYINRLKKEPVQYIVGNVDFYGFNFKVNKNTLIPRFETEELVYHVSEYIKNNFKTNINIVDIGTGTGCIGITIKKLFPDASMTLTDISKKALKIARKNSKGINLQILKGDMLKPIIDTHQKYDVIISNPPYISKKEKIMDIVKNNEPEIALYAKKDGIYYYEEILKQAKKVLNKKFLIAFEIGYKQDEKIKKIANKYLNNIKIEVIKDMSNKNRIILIYND